MALNIFSNLYYHFFPQNIDNLVELIKNTNLNEHVENFDSNNKIINQSFMCPPFNLEYRGELQSTQACRDFWENFNLQIVQYLLKYNIINYDLYRYELSIISEYFMHQYDQDDAYNKTNSWVLYQLYLIFVKIIICNKQSKKISIDDLKKIVNSMKIIDCSEIKLNDSLNINDDNQELVRAYSNLHDFDEKFHINFDEYIIPFLNSAYNILFQYHIQLNKFTNFSTYYIFLVERLHRRKNNLVYQIVLKDFNNYIADVLNRNIVKN